MDVNVTHLYRTSCNQCKKRLRSLYMKKLGEISWFFLHKVFDFKRKEIFFLLILCSKTSILQFIMIPGRPLLLYARAIVLLKLGLKIEPIPNGEKLGTCIFQILC